jgi:hypothetical protein
VIPRPTKTPSLSTIRTVRRNSRKKSPAENPRNDGVFHCPSDLLNFHGPKPHPPRNNGQVDVGTMGMATWQRDTTVATARVARTKGGRTRTLGHLPSPADLTRDESRLCRKVGGAVESIGLGKAGPFPVWGGLRRGGAPIGTARSTCGRSATASLRTGTRFAVFTPLPVQYHCLACTTPF